MPQLAPSLVRRWQESWEGPLETEGRSIGWQAGAMTARALAP
jgi:hypothetical protein